MRRSSTVTNLAVAASIALACFVSLAQSPAHAATPADATAEQPTLAPLAGPFRADGRFLRDRHGRAVFFHGVNAVWKHAPYVPPSATLGAPESESVFDARDAALLAREGFNAVRLGVLWVGVEPTPNQYDARYLAQMRELAQMLGDHRIGVLVDSHQDMYTEAYRGEGFPDWARLDRGTTPLNCCAFPLNYTSPASLGAWDDFWNDRAQLWTRFRNQWIRVAVEMRTLPNLVGYDLVNEPWPGSPFPLCMLPTGCRSFDTTKLQAMQEHVIAGIRLADARSPVWWEGNTLAAWGSPNEVGRRRPIHDVAGNTVLSFHAYCLLGGAVPFLTRAADPTCPSVHRRTFRIARQAAARNRSASALTEFGASDDLVDIARVAAKADAEMTSWFYWHYGSWKDPTGVPDSQGLFVDDHDRSSIKGAKANLLVRTYPQAVAGTPRGFGFSPHRPDRRFWLAWNANPRVRADTVVHVPVTRHYPNGYAVRVRGPVRVVSAPNAPLLQLRGTGGRGIASVVVVRRHAER